MRWFSGNNSILEYKFNSSEDYRKAEQEDIDLLTDDIKKIHELVNSNLKLRSFLIIRSKSELPRLIEKAENIINLLQAKYIN